MHNYFLFVFWISLIVCSANDLYSQKDWRLYKDNQNYKLWLKEVAGTSIKQFKIETTSQKKDMNTFYNLMRDVENMNKWYDKVKSVKLLKKISENEAIYLMEYDLPFPLEDRITTIKGAIFFDELKRTIRVETEYYPYTIPKDKSNLTLITKISGVWDIVKQKNGEIMISHVGFMNPEGNIPAWLINEGVTSGPVKTIQNMLKLLAKY
jgi:hypothetical protein